MGLVSEETLKEVVQGSESMVKVLAGTATELTNEAINLFIIEGVLSILKFAVVFVVFFIVKKFFDSMIEASSEATERQGLFKAGKTTALVLSLIYFSTMSFPHIVNISKALVAPKLFLAEKALELAKKN